MNLKYVGVWALVLLGFFGCWFLSNTHYESCNTLGKVCRYHDSFGFQCHHNDSNTDIYLRRILVKLDKISKLVDTRPYKHYLLEQRKELERKAECAEFVVDSVFTQLDLLRSGKIHTGIWAQFMPRIFISENDKLFDCYTDEIVAFMTENENYTSDEADSFRKKLLDRNYDQEELEYQAVVFIRRKLFDIINGVALQIIIREQNDNLPDKDTIYLISSRFGISKTSDIFSSACDAIESRKITNSGVLKDFIRAELLANKQSTKQTQN